MIFFVNLLFLAAGGIACSRMADEKKGRVLFALMAFTSMFLIAIFAYDSSADYRSYETKFYSIGRTGLLESFKWSHFEFGFIIFNYIVHCIFGSYEVLLMICALVTYALICYFAVQHTSHPFFFIYLYCTMSYFYNSINMIRQMLALAITLAGYKYIKERKLIKFLALVLLASSLHATALILIPLYFLVNIKITPKVVAVVLAAVFVAYMLFDVLLTIGVKIYPKYEIYLYKPEYNTGYSVTAFFVPGIFFIIILFFRKRLLALDPDNNIAVNMYMISFVLTLFIVTKFGILDRFLAYPEIYLTVCLPQIIDCVKTKEQKWIVGAAIIIIGLVMSINLFMKGYYSIYPYRSLFGTI